MAEALSDDREGPQLVSTRVLAPALGDLRVTPLETIDGTPVVDIRPVLSS